MKVGKGHILEYSAIAVFAIATGGGAFLWGWLKSALAGFSLASTLYAFAVAILLQRARAVELPSLAARHDQRASIVLIAGLALDFAALGLILLFLTKPGMDAVEVGLAAVSVLSAWILLNMLFAIHYAHRFYSGVDRDNPRLAFPGETPRVFSDFIYFAFVIGMTFQVSDVAIVDAAMRRIVLAHSILAFMFNVFVLALAVNAFGNIL